MSISGDFVWSFSNGTWLWRQAMEILGSHWYGIDCHCNFACIAKIFNIRPYCFSLLVISIFYNWNPILSSQPNKKNQYVFFLFVFFMCVDESQKNMTKINDSLLLNTIQWNIVVSFVFIYFFKWLNKGSISMPWALRAVCLKQQSHWPMTNNPKNFSGSRLNRPLKKDLSILAALSLCFSSFQKQIRFSSS